MDERNRYELYAALERALDPEAAAHLMAMLGEIQRSPSWQQWNRERIAYAPELPYRIYSKLGAGIGAEAVATFFELFDPIGWQRRGAEGAQDSAAHTVAPPALGGNHGGQ